MVRILKNSKRPATDWPEVNQSLTKGELKTSLRPESWMIWLPVGKEGRLEVRAFGRDGWLEMRDFYAYHSA